MGMGMVVISQ